MKRRILVAIAMLLVVAMSLSSCGVIDWVKKFFEQTFLPETGLTDAPLNAEKLVDFAHGAPDASVFFESDGWSNGDVFNVVWKEHNVHYENGIMRLGITEESETDNGKKYPYTAGEARSANYYHYGDYVVSMKPSANPGTTSTFFTCTGSYDVKDGTPNPHDEIDIEFLGTDTTHVQFNFFVDGKGGNEYMYDLGFDASEEFHEYGFRWTEDSITWFVDGKPVYKVTTDKNATPASNLRVVDAIPQTAGRMLANYWCGNMDAWGWMGIYNGETADNGTQYQWIATSAVGAPLNPPSDNPPAGDDDGGEGTTTVQYEFKSDEPAYKLEATGEPNSVRVKYDDIVGGSWSNVISWIDGKVNGFNKVEFKLINNAEESVKIVVQLQQGASADKTYELAAGEELDCSISYTGTPKIILFFIGSTEGTEEDYYAGDVTIANMTFSYVEPTTPPSGGEPEQPSTGNSVELGSWWSSNGGVLAVEGTNPATITFNGEANAWDCCGTSLVTPVTGKNTFSVTITNNGDASAKLRIDIKDSNEQICQPVSAVAEGYDLELLNGDYYIEIPAGQSADLVVTYNSQSIGYIVVFLDGFRCDGETYNSNVTLSDFAFTQVGSTEPEQPEQPSTGNSVELGSWWSSNGGVLAVEGTNPATITFNGEANAWDCCGTSLVTPVTGKNTFSVTITNNGDASAKLRIDIKDSNEQICQPVSAVAEGYDLELLNGDYYIEIPAGQSADLVVTYNSQSIGYIVVFLDGFRCDGQTYNSNVTLSDFAFTQVGGTAPEQPEQPEVLPDGEWLKFDANDIYTLHNEQEYVNSIRITYSEAKNQTYLNINSYIKSQAEGKTTVKFKVTNNGSDSVVLTAKVEKGEYPNNTTLGLADKIEIAAGETKIITIEYTDTPEMIYFMLDTDWADPIGTHAGDVTISNICFSGGAAAPEQPGEGGEPATPPTYVDEYLTFTTYDAYTLSPNNEPTPSLNITYSEIVGGSWGGNICSWVGDKAPGKNTFSVKIVNNGDENVNVWLQIKQETAPEVFEMLNEGNTTIAPGEEKVFTLSYVGDATHFFFFVDSTHEAISGTRVGDITMSNFHFYTAE